MHPNQRGLDRVEALVLAQSLTFSEETGPGSSALLHS